MGNLYYINPTFSRIFFRFSSAIILAFSVPFLKFALGATYLSSNFLISLPTGADFADQNISQLYFLKMNILFPPSHLKHSLNNFRYF